MANVVVVGSQWGDEGKGKIVDWLSERADVVVRYQGGHNAGHTLVIDGVSYKLSLLPSGLVRGKFSVIGNGVVVDPHHFVSEVDKIAGQGISVTPEVLRIAENAPLILSLHRELDALREDSNSGLKIGTTRRGIGPAYEDKVGRRAIRVCDLAEPETLMDKIERLLTHHNALRRGMGAVEVSAQAIHDELMAVADKILPFMDRVWELLDERRKRGERILFEGAQGTLLDIDHGTYPYVTSSNTTAGGVCTGLGVAPSLVDYVLGITKAYATRVGSGPFPSELFDDVGERIGERGAEFGATTGRKRRCGWLDLVALRRAVQLNGVSGLCVTKLDVLDGLEEIKVATRYSLDGSSSDQPPLDVTDYARCTAEYESMPGWPGPTAGITEWEKLPENAQAYLRRVEELAECPIHMVSTGPDRKENIVVRHPFG